MWRDGSATAGPATAAVLDRAVTRLREQGATVIDPVELPGTDQIGAAEVAALLHEFKHDLGPTSRGCRRPAPRSLAELISFNQRNAELVLARFGQEVFETGGGHLGDLNDPGYRELRPTRPGWPGTAMETPLVKHRLDAVFTLTASPAWLTDYMLGDHDVFHTSAPAAVGGFPRGVAAVRLRVGPAGGYLVHGPALERAPADRPGLRL